MPRVPVHSVDTAPEGAKDNLRALTQRVGKTLNIFGEMAHAPLVLDTYVQLEGRLASESSLDQQTRSAIIAIRSRTIFTNYFNHLVGTDVDLPAAPPLT